MKRIVTLLTVAVCAVAFAGNVLAADEPTTTPPKACGCCKASVKAQKACKEECCTKAAAARKICTHCHPTTKKAA